MIRLVIDHINDQIEDFSLNGLTKLIRRKEQVYPAIYSGKGESDHINFDFTKASLYHRLTGEISISQEEDTTRGGELKTTETYPMRMVAYFPNNFLGLDDGYSVLRVAANLKNKLPSNLSDVQSALNLYSAEVNLNACETDAFKVWDAEFKGVDFAVPSTHNLIYIDYTIVLTGSQNCFVDYECE